MVKIKERKVPGTVQLPHLLDDRFHYIDEFGDERVLYIWVEKTKFCITDIKQTCKYGIEGKLVE